MVRWVKIVGNQYFGFWVLGLVLFALQEIPYMLMPLFHLETNPIMNMTEASAALDICEKILGSLCIALMTFVIHENAIVSCDWVRIPGSALLSCTGKSAENVTITFTDLYVRSMK